MTARVRVFLVLIASALAGVVAAQQPPARPATIRGTVVDEQGRAVFDVSIVVFPADESRWAAATGTPAMQRVRATGGTFAIEGLPPDNYKVVVALDTTVAEFPSAAVVKQLSASGLPVALASGETVMIRFNVTVSGGHLKMGNVSVGRTMVTGGPGAGPMGAPPGAVLRPEGAPALPGSISGRVIDADGKPVAGAPVASLRRLALRGGPPVPVPIGRGAVTDAQGVYRLNGVAAGGYLVAVVANPIDFNAPGLPSASKLPPAMTASDGRRFGYVTTYFPGVTSQAGAQTITVGAVEVSGIDLRLPRVPVVELAGEVVTTGGGTIAGMPVTLLPADFADHLGGQNVQRAMINADGRFSFDQVGHGRYTISVNAGPRGWARMPFEIAGPLVAAVRLTLQPPLTVSGRVEFTGPLPAPVAGEMSKFSVALEAAPLVSGSTRPMAAVAADGTFVLSNVPAGAYVLRASMPPLAQVGGLVGDQDSLDLPVEITANVTGAVVVVVPRLPSVLATVRDELGQQVPQAIAVVFSEDQRYWTMRSRRLQIIRANPSGTFTIAGLPPGKYFVVAGLDLPITPMISPAWISSLMPRAQPFDVAAGEDRTLQVRLTR